MRLVTAASRGDPCESDLPHLLSILSKFTSIDKTRTRTCHAVRGCRAITMSRGRTT